MSDSKVIGKHTPGPWIKSRNGEIVASNGSMVKVEGFALSGISTPETRANRDLMAAAPDLLEALEGLISVIHSPPTGPNCYHEFDFKSAFAAIAKAKGLAQ